MKYNTLLCSVVLLLMGISLTDGAAFPNNPPTRTTTETAVLTKDDLAILDVVMHKSRPDAHKRLAVLRESSPGAMKDTFFLPDSLNEKSTDTLVANFVRRNRKSFELKEKRVVTGQTTIMGHRAFEKAENSEAFRKEFPAKTSMWLFFLLPGYNKDKTAAFVYAWDTNYAIHGSEYRLEKKDKVWIITRSKWVYTLDYE